jgi:hypothetical protein
MEQNNMTWETKKLVCGKNNDYKEGTKKLPSKEQIPITQRTKF